MYTKKWKQESFFINLFLSLLPLPSLFFFLKTTAFFSLALPSRRTKRSITNPLLSTKSTTEQPSEDTSAVMTSCSSLPSSDDSTTLDILVDRLPLGVISNNKETSLNSFVTSTTASTITDSYISDEGKSLKETLVSVLHQ